MRDEKVKVLTAITPPDPADTVRAQYTAGTSGGEDVVGYLEEDGVAADSHTETYAALKLEVHNWRWAGVPIYLRTGKRLARKVTEIAVQLKPVPHLAFQTKGSVGVQPNQLILTVQPNEGVSLSLGAKIPGSRMRIRPVNMEFLYGSAFMSQSPEAYERLILDAMRGDATLFTRNDEVLAQWSIIDPILRGVARDRRRRRAADVRSRARPGPPRPTRCSARTTGGSSRSHADMSEDVWSARDTTPSAIEAALRELLGKRYQEDRTFVPARVMNLVVIVDRGFRGRGGEPARARRPLPPVAAADRRGRRGPHRSSTPSRPSPPRTRCTSPGTSPSGASAWRSTSGRSTSTASTRSSTRCSSRTSRRWCGRRTATTRRSRRCAGWPTSCSSTARTSPRSREAFERAADLARSAYVVDLAWLRTTPWRERIAATFDPPPMRRALGAIDKVVVRHRADSTAAGVLLCGWLASRLGWRAEALVAPRRRADRPLPRAPRRGRARAPARPISARPASAA